MNERPLIIDSLQYCNWSDKIFQQMHDGSVSAVHATICYHENFRETVANIEQWNHWFEQYPELIVHAKTAEDVRRAHVHDRTAIVFGLQNCSPIEDDYGLIEILHTLGVRFMQLSYNNQSLLATGCFEARDTGITRFGRQAIGEMNRVGMVVDMSHSGERSTLEAIELSQRPIAITHANPSAWHPALRNKSEEVLRVLAQSGGMLGFSIYPHHLKNGPDCNREEFCTMMARTADLMGVDHIGIGSDLCQDQPDTIVQWMRVGRWSKTVDYGEGSESTPGFPPQPKWFENNLHLIDLMDGLKNAGFNDEETAKIMGGNWLAFFDKSFGAG